MAFLGKVFKFEREENYADFINSLGVPPDQAAKMVKTHPLSYTMSKDDDLWTWTVDMAGTMKDVVFQSGVEFDKTPGDENSIKSTITLVGDTFTDVQKLKDGKVLTLTKEISGDTFRETIRYSAWDGVAYRYYAA